MLLAKPCSEVSGLNILVGFMPRLYGRGIEVYKYLVLIVSVEIKHNKISIFHTVSSQI